jgi:hypothetical protein
MPLELAQAAAEPATGPGMIGMGAVTRNGPFWDVMEGRAAPLLDDSAQIVAVATATAQIRALRP